MEEILREQAEKLLLIAKQIGESNISPERVAYELWPILLVLVQYGNSCHDVLDSEDDEVLALRELKELDRKKH